MGSAIFFAILLIGPFVTGFQIPERAKKIRRSRIEAAEECANSEQVQKLQELDRVRDLPGEPEGVFFSQYAGYVTVADEAGRALFYWLTESTGKSSTKPLVLWLNGGPGCSSLAYGASEEIGPFRIHVNGTGLYRNRYSWNRAANLLFLESPAGVGFSFSNTSSDYDTIGDTRTAEDAYLFLLKWFERFPQYKHREFFILGESYAGHYVPQLAKLVHDGNLMQTNPFINLKGFMVGNAVTDWQFDNMGIVDYYWSHSLISDDTYKKMKANCDWKSLKMSSECEKVMDYASNEEFGNLDLHSIYTPVCTDSSWSSSRTGRRHWNPLWMGQAGFDPCTPSYAENYFNRQDVQKALHANNTGLPYPWAPCNYDILQNWQDKAFSVVPIYRELVEAGLRIWVYSGDQDAMVPVTGTKYWLNHLGLPIKTKWYPWYRRDQVAGWAQEYKGLTFATVRGAGHEVPVLQPDRALTLFKFYLKGEPLPRR